MRRRRILNEQSNTRNKDKKKRYHKYEQKEWKGSIETMGELGLGLSLGAYHHALATRRLLLVLVVLVFR